MVAGSACDVVALPVKVLFLSVVSTVWPVSMHFTCLYASSPARTSAFTQHKRGITLFLFSPGLVGLELLRMHVAPPFFHRRRWFLCENE